MKFYLIIIYKPDEFIQRCIVYGLEMKSLSDSQIIHNINTVKALTFDLFMTYDYDYSFIC